MSSPQTPPPAAPEKGADFFTAFSTRPEDPKKARRRWIKAGLVAVGIVGSLVAVTYKDKDKRLIITRHAATHIEPGMTRREVVQRIGKPTAYRKQDGLDCAQYSNANLQFPRFSVYTLCYEQDRLLKMDERRYALFGVMREDGSLDGPPGHDIEEAKKRIKIF